jgi:hypothetical protein
MDYKNGKIYKITSTMTDKIYIGSTCRPLCRRLSSHLNSYKQFLNGKFHNISSFELIKLGEANIELIEECNSVELLTRERFHIDLNKDICVNKCIPTRTGKEYRDANKDRKKEYNKQYHQANKDRLKERKKLRNEGKNNYTLENDIILS